MMIIIIAHVVAIPFNSILCHLTSHTQTTKMKTNKYLTLQQSFTLSAPNSFQSIKFICHLDQKYLCSPLIRFVRAGISHVTVPEYPL